MTRRMRMLPVFLVAVVALILGVTAPELWAHLDRYWPEAIRFEDAEFFIENNDTDKDIGVQAFVDGEAWKWLKIVAPNGRIFGVEAKGSLREIGLTEIRYESDEPKYEDDDEEEADMTLAEFLELFPEGRYRFYGCTVEGDFLWGKALFTYDIPCAPDVSVGVDGDEVIISWWPVTYKLDNEIAECGREAVDIVGYQVIVEFEDEETGRVLEFVIDLPGNATQVTVPAEFFERIEADPELDGEYKAEVLAIEASGNKTITEREFELEEE